MKKFKKTLVYEFEGATVMTDLAKEFSEEVIVRNASDDFAGVLSKEDFVGVDCFLLDVIDNFDNDFYDLSALKYIGVNMTGIAFLDVDFLESNGVKIKNIRGQASESVCQYMLSMFLNMIRKTPQAMTYAKAGGDSFQDFKGSEIGSKTLAIYGLGSIGSRFAEICSFFGSKIQYYSRSEKEMFDRRDIDSFTEGADILVISATFTDETEGSITAKHLSQLNDRAVILCPMDLDIFKVEDLLDYLKKNPNSTMWLDYVHGGMWEKYKKELLELDNFYVTPHSAFFTAENLSRAAILTRQNIEKFLSE